MRLLFLTSRLPYPPNRGDRLRVFNFIKSLYRQHEIHLISFIADDEELQHLPELEQYCTEINHIKKTQINSLMSTITNIWRSEPLQSLYYRSAQMDTLINNKIETINFDAVYVHLFRMAQFVIGHKNIYRILDLTDAISNEIRRSLPYRNSFWRFLYALEYKRILQYERKLIQIFDETWLISAADQKILSFNNPKANILTITNGVDIEKYHQVNITPDQFRILFSGHMGVSHNIDAVRFFAIDIFPKIRKIFPESKFIIAGAEPDKRVLDLSRISHVEVLGYVQDLNLELNRAEVFVAPLRYAAGIQNKVLEAMASGKPVVASSIVNEGINAKAGKEILIADTVDEYITQISKLFNDKNYQKEIGLAGVSFIQRYFSWDVALHRINMLEETQFKAIN